jgi:hypothetical protein
MYFCRKHTEQIELCQLHSDGMGARPTFYAAPALSSKVSLISIVGIATYLGKFPNNQFPGLAGAVLKVTSDTSRGDNHYISSEIFQGTLICMYRRGLRNDFQVTITSGLKKSSQA